jgi:hypothetical protein
VIRHVCYAHYYSWTSAHLRVCDVGNHHAWQLHISSAERGLSVHEFNAAQRALLPPLLQMQFERLCRARGWHCTKQQSRSL